MLSKKLLSATGAASKKPKALAVTHSGSPLVTVYSWGTSGGFGTKYANPATLPAAVTKVAFSPDGAHIAVTQAGTSPFVRAYPWSNSTGFGTAYTNPTVLVPNTAQDIAWSTVGA